MCLATTTNFACAQVRRRRSSMRLEGENSIQQFQKLKNSFKECQKHFYGENRSRESRDSWSCTLSTNEAEPKKKNFFKQLIFAL